MKLTEQLNNILGNYKKQLLSLEQAYLEVYKLAAKIHRQQGIFLIYKTGKPAPVEELNITSLITASEVFGRKQIPFELWADICEEGLELLKKLLEDPSILYTELEGFKEFDQKVFQRVRELKFQHGYADRFTMDAYN